MIPNSARAIATASRSTLSPNPMISVIIPAHNEASVILRCLKAITLAVRPGEIELIVVCNGCTDNTAALARSFDSQVNIIVTDIASKSHALNLGNQAANGSSRVYVDADVVVHTEAIRLLASSLESGPALAVAPRPVFELQHCSWSVRAYYQIRSLLPSAKEGIGGSGVYALSAAGRKRLGEFPAVVADDVYVRIHFKSNERHTLDSAKSIVFPPRTAKSLILTKSRSHYGSFELAKLYPTLWTNRGETNNRCLVRLFRSPRLWLKLIAYGVITVAAKRVARKRMTVGTLSWDRDHTSRLVAPKASS